MKKEKWTLERLNKLILEYEIKDDILWDKIDKNINSRSYIYFMCKIHNQEYKVRIDHVFGSHKRGCPICGNDNWSEHKINKVLLPKLESMNIDILHYNKNKINVKSDIKLKCNKCGNEIDTKIVWVKNKNFSCSKCDESHMERELTNILSDNKINFEKQKKFDGLVGLKGGRLSYDFFLPDINTLIECQGEQHYHPFGFDNSNEKFNKQVEHDNRKREFAKANKISLIEIKYNENIKCRTTNRDECSDVGSSDSKRRATNR